MPALDVYIGNGTVVKYCGWLLILFLILNIGSAFRKDARGGTGYVLLFLVMTLYCVFNCPQNGDNYTSMMSYYAYLSGRDWETLHFERIYFYIMDLVPFGYTYYRLFVWGSACLLCVWLMRRMKIKSQVAALSLLAFALPMLLYYQRAAFAYTLLYVALFCYISGGALFDSVAVLKKNYKILAVCLLLCTLPFHRAMPVYVVFLLCAFFVPKNAVGLTFLVLGLFVFSTSLVQNSVSLLNLFSEETVETGMRSLEGDTGIIGQNTNGFIGYFLKLFPLYCMLIFGMYTMIRFSDQLTEFEKVCLVNTFILMVVSVLFTAQSFTIQIKFRNAAMMPWSFFIASYYNRNCGSTICSLYAIATILTFFI